MRLPSDPPAGLIAVPMKGAVLLLTAKEFVAGVRRGKWWRRREAMLRRENTGGTHENVLDRSGTT